MLYKTSGTSVAAGAVLRFQFDTFDNDTLDDLTPSDFDKTCICVDSIEILTHDEFRPIDCMASDLQRNKKCILNQFSVKLLSLSQP